MGIERCKRYIKTEKQYGDLITAINNYSNYVSENELEVKFVKLFSTFMNEWEDWLDTDTGKLNVKKKSEEWKNKTLRILGDE